ncbi:MAG TPA: HAMP domain-containing sensor histidine kinase [Ktedonobacterales bacterium]|nr:HAMP domain-containing sensor histidine kinase [Ktedonobacterales bacterium]
MNQQRIAPATAASEAIFAQMLSRYEINQRLLITRTTDITLIVVAILGFAGNLGYVFSRPNPTSLMPAPALIGIFSSLAIFVILLVVAYSATQRQRIQLASWLTVISCMLLVGGIQLVWIIVARYSGTAHGLDDQSWALFAAYLVPIALSVVIGDDVIFYATEIMMNVIAIAVLWNAFLSTGHDLSSRQQAIGLFLTLLLTQWAVGLIGRAMRSGFRQIIYNAANLQVAVERAEQLDDLKNQFIASVNHELRNPIMSLDANLYLLQQMLDAPQASETRRNAIARLRQSVGHLRDLVESILSIRRIEQGQGGFTPQSVSVRAALDTAMAQVPPTDGKMVERELRLSMPEDLAIWGDPIRLEQILTNLLSNACKYSPAGSPVEVSAIIDPTGEHPQVVIQVSDYGLGIPVEQQPLLFERFVRLPRDLASNVTGNGLGLYLCRLYAEAMGGTIDLISGGIEGEGTIFLLRLPLPPAADDEMSDRSLATGASA